MDAPKLLPDIDSSALNLGDWAFRLGVAAVFVMFGLDKFPSDPHSEWVRIFRQIGLGDWFRYFTGVVEVAGGLLVLVPRTALAGMIVLAVTMAGAVLAHVFRLHDGAYALLPGAIALLLAMTAHNRWSR
ncbi:MAG: DoxX family protein [Acidobacteriia bacterium]|nr:DoxX family protein [Terriglobia bacterium]